MRSSSRRPIDRRKFMKVSATAALGLTIVPRHVLGGRGYIAPSDKITLAYIGTGTQGTRELLTMLANPHFQVIAVADPNKYAVGYKDWAEGWLLGEIRKAVKDPNWKSGGDNKIPGGRDSGKSIVETYYTNNVSESKYKGCAAYADSNRRYPRGQQAKRSSRRSACWRG